MQHYPRSPDELEEEYIYRVCAAKDAIGTWEDVANILNQELGNQYTESKYRKQYQAFERMFAANQRRFLDSDEYLREIDRKKAELEKERQKLYATKTEYTREIRQQSRFELFYENIKEAVSTFNPPIFQPLGIDPGGSVSLLTISDIHFGAQFESINNSYSMAEAESRFQTLLTRCADYIRRNSLNHMKIAVLGDCVQGLLRLSDLQINETSVVEATVRVSHAIAAFLNELSALCTIDYYHVPASNHTQIRPLGTKANEIASEDVEYIIGHYIQDLLAGNTRIQVNLAEQGAHIEIPIFDYNVIAMHGHTIKSVDNCVKDLSLLHRRFFDYVLLGHFHGGKELPAGETALRDIEVLISPSFVGSDPYSDSIAKGSKGSCKLYVFDSIFGHTETHKFYL